MATKIIMPQLGESVVEGTVTAWLREEGQTIAEFEPLLEVNTDKVASEIPSPASGTLLKILVPEGTTVNAGTLLAWVGEPDEKIPEMDEPSRLVEKETIETGLSDSFGDSPTMQTQVAPSSGRDRNLGFISPVVAKLAKAEGVDLTLVKGTGDSGRITKRDVLNYVAMRKIAPEQAVWETPGEGDLFRPTEMMFPAQTADKAVEITQPSSLYSAGAGRLIPHTVVRKRIAEHMAFSKRTSPHVTTVMEADLNTVVQHRELNKESFKQQGAHLTFTAYFVAAAVSALRAFPIVNSSWSEDGVFIHHVINIGIAASLGDEGLIVPVLKRADGLSLLGTARAVNDFAVRARDHRLKPDEVRDGTFTITNHGTSGSLFATPIINQPQCAILGVGAIKKRPVVINDAIAIRPMVYISLTFDHRILDGSSADGFLAKVVQLLENWV